MARVALRSLLNFVTLQLFSPFYTIGENLDTICLTVTSFFSYFALLSSRLTLYTDIFPFRSFSLLQATTERGPCATILNNLYQTLSFEESTPPFSIWTGPICRNTPWTLLGPYPFDLRQTTLPMLTPYASRRSGDAAAFAKEECTGCGEQHQR